MSIWDNPDNEASEPLTREGLEAGMRALKGDDKIHLTPCARGEHVISPKAQYSPGTYRCVNCLFPVEVPYPLAER